jgi:hypothetical protein
MSSAVTERNPTGTVDAEALMLAAGAIPAVFTQLIGNLARAWRGRRALQS